MPSDQPIQQPIKPTLLSHLLERKSLTRLQTPPAPLSEAPTRPLPQSPTSDHGSGGPPHKPNRALLAWLTSLHLQRQDLEAQLSTLEDIVKKWDCDDISLPRHTPRAPGPFTERLEGLLNSATDLSSDPKPPSPQPPTPPKPPSLPRLHRLHRLLLPPTLILLRSLVRCSQKLSTEM